MPAEARPRIPDALTPELVAGELGLPLDHPAVAEIVAKDRERAARGEADDPGPFADGADPFADGADPFPSPPREELERWWLAGHALYAGMRAAGRLDAGWNAEDVQAAFDRDRQPPGQTVDADTQAAAVTDGEAPPTDPGWAKLYAATVDRLRALAAASRPLRRSVVRRPRVVVRTPRRRRRAGTSTSRSAKDPPPRLPDLEPSSPGLAGPVCVGATA